VTKAFSEFQGVPPDSIDFFEELAVNNTKVFWIENKHRYDQIKDAMTALGDAMDPLFHPLKVFRPNRDVRFAADKSPYKTNIGMSGETEGGSIVYVHLDASGMFAASGMYMLAKDQLQRFRAGIDHDVYGPELVNIIAALSKSGIEVRHGGEAPLKTKPKGFDVNHPRIDLLCWKGIIATRTFGSPAWIHSKRLAREVEAVWKGSRPLVEWLDQHVGPTHEAPHER
jgi:uncharacterized protein (TIGR02453 family)